MKIRYGRTRSGKVVEVDWGFEGPIRVVQSWSQFADWSDRFDALCIYEALYIRAHRLTTQQDIAERDGFEKLAQIDHRRMSQDAAKDQIEWTDFAADANRVKHGRGLLFQWYLEGW